MQSLYILIIPCEGIVGNFARNSYYTAWCTDCKSRCILRGVMMSAHSLYARRDTSRRSVQYSWAAISLNFSSALYVIVLIYTSPVFTKSLYILDSNIIKSYAYIHYYYKKVFPKCSRGHSYAALKGRHLPARTFCEGTSQEEPHLQGHGGPAVLLPPTTAVHHTAPR